MKMSRQNRKMVNRSGQEGEDEDDDFYSTLAAEAGDDQDSDVSDADVAALTKALSDMDDMDDALFASSLRNRKTSTLKSENDEGTQKRVERGTGLAGTRTLTPPSLMNTADSGNRKTFTIKEDSPTENERKSSLKTTSILKKPATKSYDFGEFDEDDPLAGLLSDEEDEDPKPSKKMPPSNKPAPTTQGKGEENSNGGQNDLDSPSKESPGSIRRSTSLGRRGTEKETEEGIQNTRAKSAPPPKRSETEKKKRSEEVDFGDDDDILDTMGFDDSPPQAKKSSRSRVEDDEEIQAAKSKVADLFGKKPKTSLQEKEKPPVGRPKEFILDPKYKKTERVKAPKELDEEDFSFGSYTPSAVNTLKRPDSAPPGRRSVRFADDGDDLFGGTSTLDRPVRGAGRPRSNSQAVGASSTSVKGQTDDDNDDDWLSLAVGRRRDMKPSEDRDVTSATNQEPAKRTVDGGNKIAPSASKEQNQDLPKDEGNDGPHQEGDERPNTASAGDYLGLGNDIDLDTLLSSKPGSRLGNSRRRDTRSSFPWDDGEMDTTAGLGSTMDSKLFGDTMSTEGDEAEESHSSSLIARQVAELDKLEKEEQTKHLKSSSHPSSPRKDQIPSSGSTLGDAAGRRNKMEDDDKQPQASFEPPSSFGAELANREQPSSAGPRESSAVPTVLQRGVGLSDTGPIVQSREHQPQDDINSTPNTTIPMRRNQQGTPTARKEPQWRQELRMRQEQMQGGPPSPSHHPQLDQSSALSQDSQQPTVISNAHVPSQLPQEPLQAPASSSLSGGREAVSQSVNQWHEQIEQQRQQAQDFEQAMQEQQSRLRAQQEEGLKQMKKMQQEVMQQQLQMQQQMMQAQSLAQPPSMMSINSQPLQLPFRNPHLESKVQQLEDEKKYLETSIQSLQEQHKQQLVAKESAHQDYIRLIEESTKKKEERLLLEQEEQRKRFQDRIDEMASERTGMVAEHHQRIQELQTDYHKQREIINEGHKKELEVLSQKHQRDLEQVQQTMQEELKAINKATDHSRSLQAVMSQVGEVGQELGSLQTRISGEHQQQLERQRAELLEKDQQLRDLQRSLEHQQGEMTAERARLESMVQRLETQLRQQNTQLDEERWRLRQEQSKLAGLQRSLDEERKMVAEQVASQQVALQQARDSLSAEQQSSMNQILDERKALATERALVTRERKELEASIKQNADKMARENAEREGRLQGLMEDEKNMALEVDAVERQKQEHSKQRQLLEREKSELMREQDKLHEVAEKLNTRAQQIEEAAQDAVRMRQNGLSNLEQAREIESEQMQREQGIQEQLESLRAMERQIAKERLKQAEEERRFDALMSKGLCPNCQRGSSDSIKGVGEAFLLPMTSGVPSNSQRALNIQSYPSIRQPGMSHMSHKEEMVDHLLNKAEFNHTVSIWRLAADKDKDFLEEETSFLNSLRGLSSNFTQP